ncbi:MAG: phosphate ABC transporter permease subunit PstC [Saprospiraceae bacterium]
MNYNSKKIFERIIELILQASSWFTTLIILLIILFLFKEGFSLFHKSSLEEGSVLVLNKTNILDKINDTDLKNIFDQNISNWSEIGGQDLAINLFRIDDISNYFSDEELGDTLQNMSYCIGKLLDSIPGTIAFVPTSYINPDYINNHPEFTGKIIDVANITPIDFFLGKEWLPTAHPVAQMGALPLILGTLWVSLLAILIALPLGLSVAIYMSEIANPKIRIFIKPMIELLSGIPSVVLGFFGLVVIVPFIENVFKLPVGETALTGSIVLSIMALPTIITLTDDAIRNTPKTMKESSFALGANHWQTIQKVILPYAFSGISAAAILGIGRAVGETMAVLMVTGNAAVIPHSILEPIRTIPATIAAELGEAPQNGVHYTALFALACVLFAMTFIINLLVNFVGSKNKKSHI